MKPSRRSARSSALALLLVASCSSSCRSSTARAPAISSTAEKRPQSDPAESLERLDAIVTDLESAKSPVASRDLAAFVRVLAQSLEPLSNAGRVRLEALASRIGGVPVRSLTQSSLLKQALELLLDSLTRVQATPNGEQAYTNALHRLAETREQLDELLRLEDQRKRLTDATRAAANAVFLARGGEPPFEVASPSRHGPATLGSFDEQLAQARRDVSEVARIPLMGSRVASGRALASIAAMVEVADSEGAFTQQVAEMRFQATRLERGPRTSFGSAGWIRAGLQAAVDALKLAEGGQRSTWIDEAQRAVAGIDERSAPSFQRAAVQDAFRATVDAYAALELFRSLPKR